MSGLVQPRDLEFFSVLASSGTMTAAARELGLSNAAVTKRLHQMEERLGVALISRTTRRMSLTQEGELYLDKARSILGAIEELEAGLLGQRSVSQGLIRVNATLGFGRGHIAPMLSAFALRNPRVEVQLTLTVDPPSPADDAYDVCFRFGPPPEGRSIARFIAANRRVLVAAPAYLKRAGTPRSPDDLRRHQCIGIRQGDDAYGVWRLTPRAARGRKPEATQSVKVRGNLTTNDGGVAVNWALEGHGILLRAEWDIQQYLASGRLVEVLPDYHTPDADIYAIYPQRLRGVQRITSLIEYAAQAFVNGRAEPCPPG